MKNYWLKKEEYEYAFGNQAGYPSDDENSLIQWSAGSANLDMYYRHQFIQNENLSAYLKEPNKTTFLLELTPVLAGSMTGVLKFNNKQFTFFVDTIGVFTFTGCGHEDYTEILRATLKLNTGELILEWNGSIEPEIIASYEYEYGSKYFN